MAHGIYRLEFPDGAFYIGATTHFPSRRRAHMADHRTGSGVNERIRERFKRYPVFGIYLVASLLPGAELHELEKQVIESTKPDLNYTARPSRIYRHKESLHRAPSEMPHFYGRRFGPFASISDAAKKLKTSRSAIRGYGTYERYLQVKADKSRPTKKSAKVGPPNPYRLSTVVFIDDRWMWRADKPKFCGPPNPNIDPAILNLGDRWVRRTDVCVVSHSTYRKRVLQGLPLHIALTAKQGTIVSNKHHITVNGESRTIKQWSLKTGVPESTIHARRRYGWPDDQAVGVTPRPKMERPESKRDRLTRERKERKAEKLRAREAGIVERMTKKQAAEMARYTVQYKGQTRSLQELCGQLGIDTDAVKLRLRYGWDVTEAIDLLVSLKTKGNQASAG